MAASKNLRVWNVFPEFTDSESVVYTLPEKVACKVLEGVRANRHPNIAICRCKVWEFLNSAADSVKVSYCIFACGWWFQAPNNFSKCSLRTFVQKDAGTLKHQVNVGIYSYVQINHRYIFYPFRWFNCQVKQQTWKGIPLLHVTQYKGRSTSHSPSPRFQRLCWAFWLYCRI
jgi:hypothetical protein